MIAFPCPRCEAEISVEDGLAGQAVRCQSCLAPVTVPDALPPVRSPGPEAPLAQHAEETAPAVTEPGPASPTVQEDLPTATWDAEWAAPAASTEPGLPPAGYQPPRPKSPSLAAKLSIVPGFGHWYCGRFGRGLAYLIFEAAIIAMTVVAWRRVEWETGYFGKHGLLVIGIISFIVIDLLCMYDAYRTAQSRNREMLC